MAIINVRHLRDMGKALKERVPQKAAEKAQAAAKEAAKQARDAAEAKVSAASSQEAARSSAAAAAASAAVAKRSEDQAKASEESANQAKEIAEQAQESATQAKEMEQKLITGLKDTEDKVSTLETKVEDVGSKVEKKLDADAITQYAKTESPAFTGKPEAPTASAADASKQIATTEFVRENAALFVAYAPGFYQRSELMTPSQKKITIHPTWVNINGIGFASPEDVELGLNEPPSWDDAVNVSANTRKGKDVYVYAVKTEGSTPKFVLSLEASAPVGVAEGNFRKIGGFHCLCESVGEIAEHPLSGYASGDILPASVWDLDFRAVSDNEGMVWVPGAQAWVDIYLPSWKDGHIASVFGGTILDGDSTPSMNGEKFGEIFGLVGKTYISREQFKIAMDGSNQGTNIYGSTNPITTGGHKDTASRRMISSYGIEDGCGAAWQWGNDTYENMPGATYTDDAECALNGYTWSKKPTLADNETEFKGQCNGLLRRVILGGNFIHSEYCGSRAVFCNYLCAKRAFSSRGVSVMRACRG